MLACCEGRGAKRSAHELLDVVSGFGPEPSDGPAFNFGYSGRSCGRGSGLFNARLDASALAPHTSLRFATTNAQRMIMINLGRVGIGTSNPQQLLEVAGSVQAMAFQVGAPNFNVPDYVFNSDSKLPLLTQLALFIEQEKPLLAIPSAQDITANGIDRSAFQMRLLKKVEESTLDTVQPEHQQQKQEEMITSQAATIQALRAMVAELTHRLSATEQRQK